ncbi:MAG: DUF4340 domain-containing protein [Chloroflexi bacterium]|nr:DUF4340 domain-containing protein [Chloroflexota bacterium]
MNLRLSILLVVVLLIFGGTFLVLRFTDSNEPRKTSPWLYRIDEGDIVALELVYQGESVNYFRSPASLDWYIAGSPGDDPDIPVFQQRWGGTPLLLSGPRVTRPLSDTIVDPAEFGLEPPETSVKVFDRYGNMVEFNLGIPTPDNLNQYARLVGDDTLFTVPIEWARVVNRLVFDPPVGRLYDIEPRSVLLVQFFRGDDTTKYVIEDGTGRWFLDGETPVPVDPGAWAESLLTLVNPRLDQIIAHDIDEPALYGLDPPDTVVVIVRQGGQTPIEFHIGGITPDGKYRYVDVIAGSMISEDTNLYGVLTSRIDPIIALATDPVLEN